MFAFAFALLSYSLSLFRPKHQLALEILALRHQIMVLKRQTPRPKLRRSDSCFWVMLRKALPGWKAPLMIFQPETVILAPPQAHGQDLGSRERVSAGEVGAQHREHRADHVAADARIQFAVGAPVASLADRTDARNHRAMVEWRHLL